MTDCTNDTMRDWLPELANAMLAADEASAVRAHVAGCAACAAELAVLERSRLVLRASAPKVDLAAITLAVSAVSPAPKPALHVERGGATAPGTARQSVWRSRQFLAAAASLLIVATLAIPALGGLGGENEMIPDSVAVVMTDAPSPAPAPVGFADSEGLSDLSSDELSTLLDELEALEANVTAEPASMPTPIIDTPEVF